MSTDHGLLEMAAKAAGLPYTAENFAAPGEFDQGWGMLQGIFTFWNPLTDDGDALRLAVKLRMDISVHISHVTVEASSSDGESRITIREKIGGANETAEEATRRAIVLAAAEIGRIQP